jgi:hypothetical protein
LGVADFGVVGESSGEGGLVVGEHWG